MQTPAKSSTKEMTDQILNSGSVDYKKKAGEAGDLNKHKQIKPQIHFGKEGPNNLYRVREPFTKVDVSATQSIYKQASVERQEAKK